MATKAKNNIAPAAMGSTNGHGSILGRPNRRAKTNKPPMTSGPIADSPMLALAAPVSPFHTNSGMTRMAIDHGWVCRKPFQVSS